MRPIEKQMKQLFELLIIALINLPMVGQELKFERPALKDTAAVALEMEHLATDFLQQSQTGALNGEISDLYMFEILAGEYETSIETMETLNGSIESQKKHQPYIQYELYAKAKIRQASSGIDFKAAFRSEFSAYLKSCNDEKAYAATTIFTTYDAVAQYTQNFETNYKSITETSNGYRTSQEATEILLSISCKSCNRTHSY